MKETTDFKPICIDERSKNYLREIAHWGKFMAILGFIKLGILLLLTIVFPFVAANIECHLNFKLPRLAISLFFLLMALLVYFPSNYLYLFARYTRRALNQNDQDVLRHAFQELKACYRYIGILLIILIGLYTLAITYFILIS